MGNLCCLLNFSLNSNFSACEHNPCILAFKLGDLSFMLALYFLVYILYMGDFP